VSLFCNSYWNLSGLKFLLLVNIPVSVCRSQDPHTLFWIHVE